MTKPVFSARAYQEGDSLWLEPIPGVFEPVNFFRVHTNVIAKHPNSFAHTILLNNKVVGIVGITMIWPGMAEIWSFLSDEIKKIPILLHKGVLKGLKFYQENLGIKKFQANVKADYYAGRKWIQALGFKQEGYMPAYGPDGSDCVMYGRVN